MHLFSFKWEITVIEFSLDKNASLTFARDLKNVHNTSSFIYISFGDRSTKWGPPMREVVLGNFGLLYLAFSDSLAIPVPSSPTSIISILFRERVKS